MDRRGLLLAARQCGVPRHQAAAQQRIAVALGTCRAGPTAGGFQRGAHRKGRARGLERGGGSSVPGGRVLAQTSADQTDYRFPLAIYDGVTAKDVEVTVRFKPSAGRIDRAGGIAVRLTDADNYYVASRQCAGGQRQLLSRRAGLAAPDPRR